MNGLWTILSRAALSRGGRPKSKFILGIQDFSFEQVVEILEGHSVRGRAFHPEHWRGELPNHFGLSSVVQ